MVAPHREQVRRCALATFPPRRLADLQAGTAPRDGWYGRPERWVSLPFVGRESHHSPSPSPQRAEQAFGTGLGASAVSSSGTDIRNSIQVGDRALPGNPDGAGLAETAMALQRTSPGIQGAQGEGETIERLVRVPEIEPGLGATDRRDTPPGP